MLLCLPLRGRWHWRQRWLHTRCTHYVYVRSQSPPGCAQPTLVCMSLCVHVHVCPCASRSDCARFVASWCQHLICYFFLFCSVNICSFVYIYIYVLSYTITTYLVCLCDYIMLNLCMFLLFMCVVVIVLFCCSCHIYILQCVYMFSFMLQM